jgi:hypothetical protein
VMTSYTYDVSLKKNTVKKFKVGDMEIDTETLWRLQKPTFFFVRRESSLKIHLRFSSGIFYDELLKFIKSSAIIPLNVQG